MKKQEKIENNIIYSNKQNFLEKLENFKKDGIEKIHILADFDKTLTKAFANGEKRPSLISTLRHQNILGEEYSKRAFELFDYYNPIEIDPNIDIEEKKKQMTIWWKKHLDLFIEYGLTQNDIDKTINSGIINLRGGVKEFLEKLNVQNVPVVIISANGLGADSNLLYMKQEGVSFDNISIISNKFIWDENGVAIDYEKPVIHVFNKDETVLEKFPEIHKKIENRKNVLLLGDSLGDPDMVKGFEYDNLIKVGFLNDKEDELLEVYKKNYDIVITGDGNFDVVNDIMEEIVEKK